MYIYLYIYIYIYIGKLSVATSKESFNGEYHMYQFIPLYSYEFDWMFLIISFPFCIFIYFIFLDFCSVAS